MNKKITFLILLTFALSPLICSADMVIPTSAFGYAFVVNFLVNGIVLLISYAIFKAISSIKIWKFLIYIVIVTVIGGLIDLAGFFLTGSFRSYYLMGFSIGVLLFLFNYLFAMLFMRLSNIKSLLVGLIMAIFTNPVIMSPVATLISSIFKI
jgi:hypothetical protein